MIGVDPLLINKSFDELSLSEFEDQMRVNASAAFALIKAAVPGMKVKGYGKIVNFCSLALNGRWRGWRNPVGGKPRF